MRRSVGTQRAELQMDKRLLCECGHSLSNHFIGAGGKPTEGCRFCSCEKAKKQKDSWRFYGIGAIADSLIGKAIDESGGRH